LFFRSGMFAVGPESSGAHPGILKFRGNFQKNQIFSGPVCYRKNGYLAITDANLFLGRLIPEFFPKIFGKTENMVGNLFLEYIIEKIFLAIRFRSHHKSIRRTFQRN
jgi:N-methylhydantoinase A/oxoprolinase/acetone carboxylase beta subunit